MHDLTDAQAQEAQKKRGDNLADANRNKEEFMALLNLKTLLEVLNTITPRV